MLQEQFIINLLGIASASVDKIEEKDEEIHFFVSTKAKPQRCPACGATHTSIHDYRIQRIKDIPLYGKRAYIFLKKRRYRCMSCGKRFYEHYRFLPRYRIIIPSCGINCR